MALNKEICSAESDKNPRTRRKYIPVGSTTAVHAVDGPEIFNPTQPLLPDQWP